MINNLSIYNEWKKSTLNRMTSRFTSEAMRVYKYHLEKILPFVIKALESGELDLIIDMPDIEQYLFSVYTEHQRAVTRVGVSDGYREVTPDKKLATYEAYPIHIPVEDTFTNLAERKERDDIFTRIDRIVNRKNKSYVSQLVDLEAKRYLTNIKVIFKVFANTYHKEGETEGTESFAKDFFQAVFDKTRNQTEAIFRTETTRYFNDARVRYFESNTDVDFMQVIAITDGRISDICECRDRYVMPLSEANKKKNRPPYHVNCRTILSPLDTDLKSAREEVRRNLGSEFGTVHSNTSDKDFKGRRAPPNIPLPKGWA